MTSFHLFEKNQLVKIPSEFNFPDEKISKQILEKMLILTPVLTEDERILVGKIVSSTGMNPETDLKLIELQLGEIFDHKNYDTSRIEYILLFDFPTERTNWNIRIKTSYEWISQSGFQLMIADSLKSISKSTPLKKKLWAELKKITQK